MRPLHKTLLPPTFLAATLVGLWALAATPASATQAPPPSQAAQRAAQLYQQVCARCHETRVGPPLLGRALPPPLVEVLVRSGRAGMPAFRESEISPAELAALGLYVQHTAPAAPSVSTSAATSAAAAPTRASGAAP